MKRSLLILSLFVLTACGQPALEDDGHLESFRDDLVTSQEMEKKERKKPRLPSRVMQANALGSLSEQSVETRNRMERLFEVIDSDLSGPGITQEDIARGYYYAQKHEKLFGTPSGWVWVKDGKRSRWESPNADGDLETREADELCRESAGTYIVSCIEKEVSDCEYVAESTCRCQRSAAWVPTQGCILQDSDGSFIEIDSEDLRKGWYLGLNSEKKLNTPAHWRWSESGKQSRWHNPSTTN